ncbi:hypothetical protein [Salarchaeum sp. JOR-1]|uniref:hypothetical protein n=1 Tax=Salarchaeum sp. JOR-1 TaxID=2599399 RepID=UPI0011986573|nr:hypothetical protein [Salarchaeum sp. JOR-1]QDX40445.1 hypothetical protein FQU85_05840 [Salarchaeum sp. JOR-1]
MSEELARALTRAAPGDRAHATTDSQRYTAVVTATEHDDTGVRVAAVPESGDDWLELRATRTAGEWTPPTVHRLQHPEDDWTKLGRLVTLDLE